MLNSEGQNPQQTFESTNRGARGGWGAGVVVAASVFRSGLIVAWGFADTAGEPDGPAFLLARDAQENGFWDGTENTQRFVKIRYYLHEQNNKPSIWNLISITEGGDNEEIESITRGAAGVEKMIGSKL